MTKTEEDVPVVEPEEVPPDDPAHEREMVERTEPERVIDVEEDDVVEVSDQDLRPTIAEYEHAREIVRADLENGEPDASGADGELDPEIANAYDVLGRAERHGIRPVAVEDDLETAGVAVATLPAIRDAIATQEVERRQATPPTTVLPSPKEWEAAIEIARRMAATSFVPRELRGKPDEVLACILTGREMGIGAMQALRQIHMIDGRPAFSAELMLSKMKQGGMRILDYEATDERAWIRAQRRDTGEIGEAEWTMEEARRVRTKERGRDISLAEKSTFQNYPSDMLWARCVGRWKRRFAPDMLGGMSYTAEEVQDFEEFEGSYAVGDGPKPGDATFRVERDRRPGAPASWSDIAKAQLSLDKTANWKGWSAAASAAVYGETEFGKLTEEQKSEFGCRLANAIDYLIVDVLEGADFPPPTVEQIQQAYAYGFDGAVLEPPPPLPADPESDEKAKVEGDATPEPEGPGEGQPASDAALDPEAQEALKSAPAADIDF